MGKKRAKPDKENTSRYWLIAAGLLLLVLVAYFPVFRAGYIWDDNVYLTQNRCIIGPKGLWEIWTSSEAQICPFVISTFWLIHAGFGMDPQAYHFANLLFHGLSAILLWQVLKRLKVPGAAWGAAIWAVHPVQVESVAWVSEMKNTESAVFFLCAILSYLRFLDNQPGSGPKRRGYGWVLLFSALAMASKSSTVILPIVLALCAWWRDRSWSWRRLFYLWPVAALSALTALVSVWTQIQFSNKVPLRAPGGWMERIVTAANEPWFYLGKLLWPHPLLTIYPGWEPGWSHGQPGWLSWLGAAATLAVLVALWLLRKGKWRGISFAYFYFLAALLPVLGFVSHPFLDDYGAVADHFQYLASMGPLALVGCAIALSSSLPWLKPKAQFTAAAFLCGLLALVTWQQAEHYEDPSRLWAHEIQWHPNCWAAYNELGSRSMKLGDSQEALTLFEKALQLQPDNHYLLSNAGLALCRLGRFDESIADCQRAIALDPMDPKPHNTLAANYLSTGKIAEAVICCNKALAIYPDFDKASCNLAWILATCPDDKIRDAPRAVREAEHANYLTGGTDPSVLRVLAAAYANAGRFDEAVHVGERGEASAQSMGEAGLTQALASECANYRQSMPTYDLSLKSR
jgi:tetratricopeptide (TPR) repeat protein